MKYRDYQMSKLYYAETKALPFLEDTMSYSELELECDKVLNSKFVEYLIDTHKFCSKPSKTFYIMRGDKRYKYAQSNNDFVCFPKGTRNSATICHELAHCITIKDSEDPNLPYHGKEFCYIYLQLVKKFMGSDFYFTLRESFIEEGVDFEI